MTTTSAYAPYSSSYEQRTPYITSKELLDAPTALDYTGLVPGNPQANAQVLVEVIARASSWVDQYCMGAWGTLCATQNTENARVWGSYRNTLIVHPKYWPLLEVVGFSYSTLPAGLVSNNAASITPAGNIAVYPQEFEVSLSGAVGWGLGAPSGIVRGFEYVTQFEYVNGWPTSTSSASIAVGATSISPVSTMGIYPGTTLTIYDDPNDEQITVASTYVPHTTPVPLTAGTQYAHASGVMISNLPPAVKQAAILVTAALVKQRGSGGLVVQDMGAITHQAPGLVQNESDDIGVAMELLHPFKMMYLGT